MTISGKKLYRSRNERMLGGICGGIGEFFDVDPTLIRLATVLLAFFFFPVTLIVYLILLIVIPREPDASETIVSGEIVEAEGRAEETE